MPLKLPVLAFNTTTLLLPDTLNSPLRITLPCVLKLSALTFPIADAVCKIEKPNTVRLAPMFALPVILVLPVILALPVTPKVFDALRLLPDMLPVATTIPP